MQVQNKLICVALLALTTACAGRKTNIEKELVDQVIAEFTTERILHHLHGNGPRSNSDFLDRVLKRHSVRLIEFSPAFKRYAPEIHGRLLGAKSSGG